MSSATNIRVATPVIFSSRTRVRICFGIPPKTIADTRTLVSMTTRSALLILPMPIVPNDFIDIVFARYPHLFSYPFAIDKKLIPLHAAL